MHKLWTLALTVDRYTSLIHSTTSPLNKQPEPSPSPQEYEAHIIGEMLHCFIKSRLRALENDYDQMKNERDKLIQKWEKEGEQIIPSFPTFHRDFSSLIAKIPDIHQPTGFPDWLMRKVPMKVFGN